MHRKGILCTLRSSDKTQDASEQYYVLGCDAVNFGICSQNVSQESKQQDTEGKQREYYLFDIHFYLED
jgi:hypothetical protein